MSRMALVVRMKLPMTRQHPARELNPGKAGCLTTTPLAWANTQPRSSILVAHMNAEIIKTHANSVLWSINDTFNSSYRLPV